jgi:hypothetical protein
MSQKVHGNSNNEAEAGEDPGLEVPLLSLPDLVLAHIARLSNPGSGRRGHPMLQLSRGCRDAVLSSLTSAEFFLRDLRQIRVEYGFASVRSPVTKGRIRACGRLLHRICSQSAPGLQVTLKLYNESIVLPVLLRHGIDSGGWDNVHTLKVGDAS